MWVSLDHFGRLLLEGTLATILFLSQVVVFLLLCRQPSRRIVVAKAAIIVAVLMLPAIATCPRPDFLPLSWIKEYSSVWNPDRSAERDSEDSLPEPRMTQPLEGSGAAGFRGVLLAWWRKRYAHRALTLVYLAGVSIGLVWLCLGVWGVDRMIRRAEEPRAGTAELYQTLSHQILGRTSSPTLLVTPADQPTGSGRAPPIAHLDSSRIRRPVPLTRNRCG